MADTAIEWTRRPGTKGKTWNPLGGCSEEDVDCAGCYAKGMAARIPNMARARGDTKLEQQYAGLTKRSAKGRLQWTGVLRTFDDRLEQPLAWKSPCTVFVNSMSDLFHADVPFDFVRKVWGIMARCPQHTFIILTKRTDRLLEFVREHGCPSNAWLGFSAGNQETFDRRGQPIPALRDELGPAAVLLASLEPLIGPIHMRNLASVLSWAITGGESNQTYHKARECDVQWIRSIVAQCVPAGLALFIKQLGATIRVPDAEPIGDVESGWSPYARTCISDDFLIRLPDSKGGNIEEWPLDLRVRQFPKGAT